MTRFLRFALPLVLGASASLAAAQEPAPAAPPASSAPEAQVAPASPAAPAAPTTPAPSPTPRARRAPPPVTPPAPPPVVEAEVTPVDAAPCEGWRHDPMFRLGQDFVVRRDEAVGDAIAVFGDVVVEGQVCENLSVTLGNVRLVRGASVHGSVVVVGGTLTVEPGVVVDDELVLVGGALDAPADFRAGRGHVIVGLPVLGERLRGAVPYITRGVLYGRLIVPDLAWVWVVVGVVFFVYLLVNLLFPQATLAAANVIAERPLSTFAAGVLVLVLSGPVATLLAVTVIGIAALPVLLCAMVVAWIVGKIAVCRWIGTRVWAQEDAESRLESVRAFALGFAVLTLAYLIPVLGVIVWGLTGVLGLGATTMAFVRAFRKENPPAPPRAGRSVPTPPVPPAVPAVPGPAAGAVGADTSDLMLNRSASSDTFGLPQPALAGDVPPMPPPAAAAAPVPEGASLLAFPFAAFAERAAAFALDFVLVLLTAAMLGLDEHGNLLLFLLVAYHVAFWTWKQTTIGGIICQLRVTRVDGAPLRFVDALVRGLTAIFSMAAFGIGALWILRDAERQSWHDKVAGTYVVRVPRNHPL